MKYVILFAAFVLCAAHASAQTVIQCKSASDPFVSHASMSTGNMLSDPVTGHVLIFLAQNRDTISSVTDTIGNTYTATPNSHFPFNVNELSIYYAVNGSTATNAVTATFATTSSYTSVTVCEVSGIDIVSTFVDDDAETDTTNTVTTGSLLPGGNTVGILFIAVSIDLGNNQFDLTPFSGYTVTFIDTSQYVWIGYHMGVTVAEVAGGTTPNSDDWGILGAAFKASVADTIVPLRTVVGVGN